MAPENILCAAQKVLFVAAYTTRNWALDEDVSRKQIYDLWDAIHEIPDLLIRWPQDSESELLMYLDCYNEKWPTPRLRGIYENEMNLWG